MAHLVLLATQFPGGFLTEDSDEGTFDRPVGSLGARRQRDVGVGTEPTGEIFGKVTDESGAVLPGVPVTLTSPVLLQPLTAITSETGTYQFPRLAVGTYTVKFELTGFKTVVNEGIQRHRRLQRARSTRSWASRPCRRRSPSPARARSSTRRKPGTKQTFTNELLQSIPSARDPWVILQQTAGIAMDRENIGGNMSGQQSNYVSRGAQPDQQQVVARRRRHHRHVGDRRVAELLRLRRVRGDDDQHRRRRRDAADRRRRHQPRDQERHRPVQGLVALLQHRRERSKSQNITDDAARRRARRRATRSRTSRTTASRSAARSRRAARGCGAASASRSSTSASSASTSRRRRARRSRRRRSRWPRRSRTSTPA